MTSVHHLRLDPHKPVVRTVVRGNVIELRLLRLVKTYEPLRNDQLCQHMFGGE